MGDQDEQILLVKHYEGHDFEMLANHHEGTNKWTILAQCLTCEIHFHQLDQGEIVGTAKPILNLLDIEMQMHSAGITEGWEEGLAFFRVRDDA